VLDDYENQNQREIVRSKYNIHNDDIVFGVVGRLSPEKGCFEMLKAFALVHEERAKTKLLMIGKGPLDLALKKKAEDLGLAEAVVLTGYRSPVNPFYEAIDVIVCPSITEGLSNVILEALAYRLPVIATDVGGNGEIIKNGFNGILLKSRDINEIAKSCLRLVDDCKLAGLMAERGRETVEKKFEFSQRMRKEEEFYALLCEGDH
jgi:glycosyltransferase involved in cell wall biosynthesis